MSSFILRYAWWFWLLAVALQMPLLINGEIYGKCFASFCLGAALVVGIDLAELKRRYND